MEHHPVLKLNYKRQGSGPVVLMLHGLLGSLDNWQTMARFLSHKYEVYTIDLRNHGKSPHTRDFSISRMAEDIANFLKEHRLTSVYLAGHSLGGKVALQLLNQGESKIKKCMVLDIAPKAYPDRHESIFKALFSLNLELISTRAEAQVELLKSIRQLEVCQFLLKNLDRNKEGKFEWKFNLNAIYEHYADINKKIDFRRALNNDVLFVKGELSDYILKEDESEILMNLPNAKFEVVLDAGHWIHADKPRELLILMETYFQ